MWGSLFCPKRQRHKQEELELLTLRVVANLLPLIDGIKWWKLWQHVYFPVFDLRDSNMEKPNHTKSVSRHVHLLVAIQSTCTDKNTQSFPLSKAHARYCTQSIYTQTHRSPSALLLRSPNREKEQRNCSSPPSSAAFRIKSQNPDSALKPESESLSRSQLKTPDSSFQIESLLKAALNQKPKAELEFCKSSNAVHHHNHPPLYPHRLSVSCIWLCQSSVQHTPSSPNEGERAFVCTLEQERERGREREATCHQWAAARGVWCMCRSACPLCVDLTV